MCGIAGIFFLNTKASSVKINHSKVLMALNHRGPDYSAYQEFENCVLYHSRLTIIDTSASSNQPFSLENENSTLVFNGEIFNYKDFQNNFSELKTQGDVEILYRLLKTKGLNCLNSLNGFFAFAHFNKTTHQLLLARDRMGVKPLYYYKDENCFAFASELKPLLHLIGPQTLNQNQINTYFRLNYCAGNETIFKNVFRLMPSESISISPTHFEKKYWYQIEKENSKQELFSTLNDAVKIRLNADVPVGTFLSGGLDSSIISALAKIHKPDLKTFSIGFSDHYYFDETVYSNLVAKHINSNHQVFKLKEEDFLHEVQSFLNCIDEPFADSSAFNFYMLSKYTRTEVKVALSGDGADEIFKGYQKHKALYLSHSFLSKKMGGFVSPFMSNKEGSRQGFLKNKLRQLNKFSALNNLSEVEKQKYLASISHGEDLIKLLKDNHSSNYFDNLFQSNLSYNNFDLNDSFDLQTVLADDMLVKADRYSMQHGIEIRNPFLDYRVVEFALNTKYSEKINAFTQKIILKKTFGHLLPNQILKRSKKGFELPLQKWLSNHLKEKINKEWLNEEKINSENILNFVCVEELKQKMFSNNPGDSAAKLWAIIVFEAWIKNFNEFIKH